jgi:hypothetical protein
MTMMKQLLLVLFISGTLITINYSFVEKANINTINSAAQPEDVIKLKAKVIKAGLFKVIRSGGLVKSANTSTGKAISKPVIQLVKTTTRIPLVKDAHMSLQYRIWNLPEQPAYIKLRRVLKHPAMTLPDGKVSTGSDYMINGHVSIGQVIAYTGYGLNEEYEMLEGEWTFQIWYQDKKLVEQTFVTYWPDETEVQSLGGLSPPERVKHSSTSQSAMASLKPSNSHQQKQTAAKRNWMN